MEGEQDQGESDQANQRLENENNPIGLNSAEPPQGIIHEFDLNMPLPGVDDNGDINPIVDDINEFEEWEEIIMISSSSSESDAETVSVVLESRSPLQGSSNVSAHIGFLYHDHDHDHNHNYNDGMLLVENRLPQPWVHAGAGAIPGSDTNQDGSESSTLISLNADSDSTQQGWLQPPKPTNGSLKSKSKRDNPDNVVESSSAASKRMKKFDDGSEDGGDTHGST